MKKHIDSTVLGNATLQKKNSRSPSNLSKEQPSNPKSTQGFIDNRHQVSVQNNLIQLIENSPRIKQLQAVQEMANRIPQDNKDLGRTSEFQSQLIATDQESGKEDKSDSNEEVLQMTKSFTQWRIDESKAALKDSNYVAQVNEYWLAIKDDLDRVAERYPVTESWKALIKGSKTKEEFFERLDDNAEYLTTMLVELDRVPELNQVATTKFINDHVEGYGHTNNANQITSRRPVETSTVLNLSDSSKRENLARELSENNSKTSYFTKGNYPVTWVYQKRDQKAGTANVKITREEDGEFIKKFNHLADDITWSGTPDESGWVRQDKRSGSGIIQLITGAANTAGLDIVLPGAAGSLGEAALKISKYINTQARTGAGGAEVSSVIGANNANNYYIRSNYNTVGGASFLETWTELTPGGGGYVKRVRVTGPGGVVMDRVMNEAAGTALQIDLASDRHGGAGALTGAERYDAMHGTDGGDSGGLNFGGATARDADNITKVVGEGARFAWIAKRLSEGTLGNTSKGVLKIKVKIPQIGSFSMDPTFQQLWGAWDSVFERRYLKNKKAAAAIVKRRLSLGWKRPNDTDGPGTSPLASGATATAQVTSLSTTLGKIALVPDGTNGVNGPGIVTDLAITWKSDR